MSILKTLETFPFFPNFAIEKYKILKHHNNLPPLNLEDREIVRVLKEDGIFISSLEKLSVNFTSQIHLPEFHQEIPIFYPNFPDNDRSTKYRSETILHSYPDIFLSGLDERLLNIAENYIGLPVAYHGSDCRKYVANNEEIGAQSWHEDPEDRRILKILIYLNDVSLKNAPFEYISKHLKFSYQGIEIAYKAIAKISFILKIKIFDKILKYLEGIMKNYPSKSVTGSRSTIVFVDTKKLLHRNRLPQGERISLFYIYTSQKPQRPDVCATNFYYNQEDLVPFESVLSPYQRESIKSIQNNFKVIYRKETTS